MKKELALLLLILLILTSSFISAVSYNEIEIVLKNVLIKYFEDPSKSVLTTAQIRDFLDFYFSLPKGKEVSDLSAIGKKSGDSIETIYNKTKAILSTSAVECSGYRLKCVAFPRFLTAIIFIPRERWTECSPNPSCPFPKFFWKEIARETCTYSCEKESGEICRTVRFFRPSGGILAEEMQMGTETICGLTLETIQERASKRASEFPKIIRMPDVTFESLEKD